MAAPVREDHSQACFGFTVRSSRPFRFLRHGGGGETLDVLEVAETLTAPEETLLFKWLLRDPTAAVTAKLYHADGLFHFWTSDAGWYRIDPAACRIEMSPHADEIRHEQRLWGVPTSVIAKARGAIVLHGAAVEVDGSAVVFAAPGRFGKTTLALAFHRAGYRLLTEDTTCCWVNPEPILFPGPTSVRLRPDMYDGQTPSGTTVVEVRNDRVHLVLNPDTSGDGRPLPIRALVFLRESPQDIVVERLKGGEALPDLWSLLLRFKTDNERRHSFSQLARLAGTVPIWNLYRPLTMVNLEEVVSRIVQTCR